MGLWTAGTGAGTGQIGRRGQVTGTGSRDGRLPAGTGHRDRWGQVTPDVGTVGAVVKGTAHSPIPAGSSDEWLTLHGDPADIVTAEVAPSPLLAAIVAALPAWHTDALCRESDLDLWFPRKGERNQPALDICGRCTVRVDCLAEALDDPTLDFGIRGGMTANARSVARRNRPAESEAS